MLMISRRLTYRSCLLFLTPLDRNCRPKAVFLSSQLKLSSGTARLQQWEDQRFVPTFSVNVKVSLSKMLNPTLPSWFHQSVKFSEPHNKALHECV